MLSAPVGGNAGPLTGRHCREQLVRTTVRISELPPCGSRPRKFRIPRLRKNRALVGWPRFVSGDRADRESLGRFKHGPRCRPRGGRARGVLETAHWLSALNATFRRICAARCRPVHRGIMYLSRSPRAWPPCPVGATLVVRRDNSCYYRFINRFILIVI